MKTTTVSPERLVRLRGTRSREVIAHELRRRGHGTDAKAIWRYETGRNQPSARVLPDYAAALGVGSVDELYGSDDEEESDPMSLDIAAQGLVSALIAEIRRATEGAKS